MGEHRSFSSLVLELQQALFPKESELESFPGPLLYPTSHHGYAYELYIGNGDEYAGKASRSGQYQRETPADGGGHAPGRTEDGRR